MDQVTCGICGKKSPYSNSPGNFRRHLEVHHKEEFENAEISIAEKGKSQAKITEHFKSSINSVKKYKSDQPKQKQCRNLLIQWIVKSIQPFCIVEDQKFRELISLLDPQITVPSRRTVTLDVVKLFKKKMISTKAEFVDVKYFCGATDAGSSLNNDTYIEYDVHWVDSNTFEAKKKIISCQKVDLKKADFYREHCDDKLDDHGIKNKMVAVSTDNEATMRKCFESSTRNGCFSHIESKSSQKALDSSSRLKVLRKKLRKIAKKANKSSKFKGFVKKEQAKRNLRLLAIKQEVATRFTCTHIMFKSFLNDPNENSDLPADREKIDKNIEAINEALRCSLKKKDYEEYRISSADVDLMIKLMPTLDILEEGIRILGGEKYCTGSVVLPFLVQFIKLLEPNDEDPVFVSKFKQVLSEELTERCQLNLHFSLLAKASFFDKRFSKLLFLDKIKFPVGEELTKPQILLEITSELETLAEEVERNDLTQETEVPVQKKAKKAKFLSGFCDGDNVDDVRPKSDPREELERYQRERDLKISDNPLVWWKNNKQIYPLMSYLAPKYLCIQATSTSAERAFSMMGNIVTKKRSRLSPEHVNMLAYLSDCI